MSSKSAQSPRSRSSTPGSRSPPDSPKPSRGTKSRKLGDFAKLQALSSMSSSTLEQDQSSTKNPNSPTKMSPRTPRNREKRTLPGSETPATLGNFSKIFDQFSVSGPTDSSSLACPDPTDKAIPIKILKRSSSPQPAPATLPINASPKRSSPKKTSPKKGSPKKGSPKKTSSGYSSNSSSGSGPGSGSDSDLEHIHPFSTPASTPPSSAERDPSPLAKFARERSRSPKSKKNTTVATKRSAVAQPKVQGQIQQLLTYQYHKYGPITPVYDSVLSKEAKHESLANKLVNERVQDRILGFEKPDVQSNGVHVFIDMSNISISFLKAVRARYSLPDAVRFTPLPSLNLSFLHELLVRGRSTKVLNAGCSVRPDRAEPTYIQDLRALGYRVDLRQRRADSQGGQAPVETRGASGHPRYVEDMVDETLQIRIGESVMKYFDEPGTLILATGDARPAKFSDGFFTYAERALKMGWNVEVVSWKASLSGAWTNPAWAKPWGDRFRVIELDGFLDDLLACYAS
ncbi:hypothetical protein G7Z17_g5948 [Cylindrodendrum hubeiense]|uniref:NYN domain-containing protein n=1 Tax=Cylindrodendrum hubeiense TaxID=595255 RepID=A0A9P5LGT3_9HYPO|nr:hypothetical protein G7Z17_g5948 [Cylindrodendrum hubeiense]